MTTRTSRFPFLPTGPTVSYVVVAALIAGLWIADATGVMPRLLSFGDQGWGDELLRGAIMTVLVSVAAFAIGTVFGTLGAAMKLSRSRVLRVVADVYTTVIRGVPELLVIYLLFFGGSGAAGWIAGFFGYQGYIEPNNFVIGALAVGLVSGAYSTEVLRGAVQAVPKGQIEAARACGMRGFLILRRIIAPLALRYAVPGLGNVWQLTLKDTALISVTGLAETMRWAHVASGVSHQPFPIYLSAAVLYLIITTVSADLFRRAELFANRGVRRA